jgi:hypothetical protein
MLILAFFLAGCGLDFGAVEEGYRGVFDYKPQAGLSYTTTVAIEGDLVTISRDDNSTASPPGVRLGKFHVSAVISQRNTADGARIHVLFNVMEKLGYFNEGERNIFYIDDAREHYFIRRGSGAVVEPAEPEYPEDQYY